MATPHSSNNYVSPGYHRNYRAALNGGGGATPNVPVPVAVALKGGLVSSAYSETISAVGGYSAYTYAVSSGSLPTGTSLNTSTGVISGTPTVAGTYSFNITVTDSHSNTGTQSFTITIASPSYTLEEYGQVLHDGIKGTAYSETITGTGGTGPYTFAVASGALPTGLSLNTSTGVISGTPSATGTFTFGIQVTDAGSVTITETFSISITAPVIIEYGPALADGIVGTAFSETLSSGGGTSSYTYVVTSGSLPPGLSLASGGAITGTPTTVGVYSFTVTATDANGQTGAQAFQITVLAAPSSGGGSWVF